MNSSVTSSLLMLDGTPTSRPKNSGSPSMLSHAHTLRAGARNPMRGFFRTQDIEAKLPSS
jgi:hypothetical protein